MFQPRCTICQHLVRPKDKLSCDYKCDVIYNVRNKDFQAEYIGMRLWTNSYLSRIQIRPSLPWTPGIPLIETGYRFLSGRTTLFREKDERRFTSGDTISPRTVTKATIWRRFTKPLFSLVTKTSLHITML